jgi:DNA-binding MarR family transcriptional regulator
MEIEQPKRLTRAPKKVRAPSYYITPRDKQILIYVWRWKIASTGSIHEAINRPLSPYSTYKVLERLEKNNFIECRFDFVERFYVWTLTRRGFETILPYLDELSENGYLSEFHRHDRLVQAFQLGEWATNQYPGAEFYTEQEMRRRDATQYPLWVPQTREHRADGYTKLTGETKSWTFAYEVELSAKSVQKYEAVIRFYRGARGIDRVFWLVGSDFIRTQVLTAKTCIKDDTSNYHVFVALEDFEKNGWDAAVFNERSEKLFTLREKHREICGDLFGDIIGAAQGLSSVSVHLLPNKILGKSRT